MTQTFQTIPFGGTTHLPVTFPDGAGTILFVPAPTVIAGSSVVIPPLFAPALVSREPIIEALGLQIPVSFGSATITRGEPEDPEEPPVDPPPVPGGSTVAVGDIRSAALPLEGMKIVGNR
jgi:hypothetical protein